MASAGEHPEVTALENLAWSLKDAIADFQTRKSVPETELRELRAIGRDIERLTARVVTLRDRYKRKRPAGAPEARPAQIELRAVGSTPSTTTNGDAACPLVTEKAPPP